MSAKHGDTSNKPGDKPDVGKNRAAHSERQSLQGKPQQSSDQVTNGRVETLNNTNDVRDLQKAKTAAHETLKGVGDKLEAHPQLKGQYLPDYQTLKTDYDDTSTIWRKASQSEQANPDFQKLLRDEFSSIQKHAGELDRRIETNRPAEASTETIPAYVKENRLPQDKETILAASEFQRTGLRVKGAVVYQRNDGNGNYYHRDTMHRGEGAHLEVYNSQGTHTGTVFPDGRVRTDYGEPGRKLPKN